GSVCTLLYTAEGAKQLPKEALEMHTDGISLLLDDYKSLIGFDASTQLKTKKQEKGHYEELIAFHEAIVATCERGSLWTEALEASRIAFEVDQKVRAAGDYVFQAQEAINRAEKEAQ